MIRKRKQSEALSKAVANQASAAAHDPAAQGQAARTVLDLFSDSEDDPHQNDEDADMFMDLPDLDLPPDVPEDLRGIYVNTDTPKDGMDEEGLPPAPLPPEVRDAGRREGRRIRQKRRRERLHTQGEPYRRDRRAAEVYPIDAASVPQPQQSTHRVYHRPREGQAMPN